jgi:hypothetical protein
VDDLQHLQAWIEHRFGGTPEEQASILKRFERFLKDHPEALAHDLSWSRIGKLVLVENISGKALSFDFEGDGG